VITVQFATFDNTSQYLAPSRGLCSGIHTLGRPHRGARATSSLSLQEILVTISAM